MWAKEAESADRCREIAGLAFAYGAKIPQGVVSDSADGRYDSLIVDDAHGDEHQKRHGNDNNRAPVEGLHQPIASYLQKQDLM